MYGGTDTRTRQYLGARTDGRKNQYKKTSIVRGEERRTDRQKDGCVNIWVKRHGRTDEHVNAKTDSRPDEHVNSYVQKVNNVQSAQACKFKSVTL